MTAVLTPEGFRHHIDIQVRWGDLDALGHVNNAVFLTYMEQARITYMNEQHLWDGSDSGLGVIMARIALDYKLPLIAADEVHVFSRCVRLGNRSFEIEQQIIRIRDGQQAISAQGTTTGVAYDYRLNQSVPIPAAWRERLKAYEIVPPQE
jgi:acyl-CoA thioester hydrolase